MPPVYGIKLTLESAEAIKSANQLDTSITSAVNHSKLLNAMEVKPVGGLYTATGEFKAFETEVKNAAAEVENFGKKAGDAGQAAAPGGKGAFSKMFDGFDTGMSRAMVGIGEIAVAAMTIKKAFEFASDSVEKFEKRDVSIRGVASTIHSMGLEGEYTANELLMMADGIEKFNRYAVETNDVLDLSTYLLTFDNITKDQLPRATQLVVDLSRKMDTDLKGAALSVGIALDNPAEGLTRLGRSGIKFSKDEKEAIQALVDTGNAAAAQEMIFDKLEKKIGGFARNTVTDLQTFENKIDEMFSEFERSVGRVIVSVLDPFIKAIGDMIPESAVDTFDRLTKSVKENSESVEPLLSKYQELYGRWDLNAEQEKELSTTIAELGSRMPDAITAWDKYGTAIGISTTKIRENILAERDRLAYANKEAIQQTFNDKAAAEAQMRKLEEDITRKGEFKTVTNGLNVSNVFVEYPSEVVSKKQAEIEQLGKTIKGIELEYKRLSGIAPEEVPHQGGTGGAKTQKQLDEEDTAAKKRVETDVLAFELGKADYQQTVETLEQEAARTHELLARYEIEKKIQELRNKELEKTGINSESIPQLGTGRQWLGNPNGSGAAFVDNFIQQPTPPSRFNFKRDAVDADLSQASKTAKKLEFAKSQFESDPKKYEQSYLNELESAEKLAKTEADRLAIQKQINAVIRQQKSSMDIFQSAALSGIDALVNALDTGFKGAWTAVFGEATSAFEQFAASFFATIEQMIVKMSIFQALKAAGPLGGLTGMIGKAFGFLAEGGIINQPLLAFSGSGRGYVMGESGAEAVIPLSRLNRYSAPQMQDSGAATLSRIERGMKKQKAPVVYIHSETDFNKYRQASSDLERREGTRKI